MHRPATEQIAVDLHGSLSRLDAAGTRTAEALNHAERVQVRSRGTGFHGIAQGMAQAVGLLRNIRAQVPALAQSVDKAAAPIRQSGDAANPEQVKAKLAAAANEISNARTGMDSVLNNLAQIRSHIATVLRGGQPGPLIAIVDGAKQAVAQAADHLHNAQRKITEAANEAGQIGATASGGADPAPASVDSPAVGSAGTPGTVPCGDPRASPLGNKDAWPDPSLPPEEHQVRVAEGLARARKVLGRHSWDNSQMAGWRYFDELPEALKETYPDGVVFSYEGFPIFDDYATQIVVLEDGFVTRHGDFKKANQECGFDKTPAGMTWHHKEDGKTLILIDKKLHATVSHWGGVSITKALNRHTERSDDGVGD